MSDSKTSSELIVSAAINLHQAGKDRFAIDILLDAIRDDPLSVPAHVLLGVLHQAVGNFNECEASYRKALELDPINSEALQGLGLFLVFQKRYQEAVPYLRAHIEKDPTDQKSVTGLMEAFHYLPDREHELESILQTIWQQTRDAKTGIQFAQFLAYRDKKSEVRKILPAIAAISNTESTLSQLALVCINHGLFDEAIAYAKNAIELAPSSERTWRYLSQSWFRKGNYEEALQAINRALEIAPNHPRGLLDKAIILFKQEQYKETLDILNLGSITLKKVSPTIQNEWIFFRILSLINLHKYDEALLEINQALDNNSQDINFYKLKIIVLRHQEKYTQVLDMIAQAREQTGENIDSFDIWQYEALLCLGKAGSAGEVLDSLLSPPINTDKLERFSRLGVNLYLSGKKLEAQELYRQLMRFKTDDPQVLTNLGFILIGEGQHQEAEQLLIRVSQSTQSSVYLPIALCDLAYLYCITENFEKAIQVATSALETEFVTEDAYLRVPQWKNGKISPDSELIPKQSTLIGNNARACIVFAAWALNQPSSAIQTLQSITDENLRHYLEESLKLSSEDLSSA